MNSSKIHNEKLEIVCGIDEAGRGPVLGPMVLCGVCFNRSKLDFLSKIGVKDSKKLSTKKRNELSKMIKDHCYSYKVIIINAKEIDQRKEKRISINRLEEFKIAEIINELKPAVIYIDAADVDEKRFGNSIKKLIEYSPKQIISKHKADDTYPIVSAGSIIAKDIRDNLLEELKEKFGDFGSGYPSDIRTTNFLREWIKKNKKPPYFARKSWDTTKKILNEEVENRKISDYFK
ncbi:MAG: ribonuclease HII [Promethearchaeota archaeon]